MAYDLEDVKVLIVEDMPLMASLLRSVLYIFGFKNIIVARDGIEGFEKFCRHNPDMVITDWVMSPGNGIDMIHRIRNDDLSPNPYVPIILTSGYSERARVEVARDKGMTEFLAKPYKTIDLYQKIVWVIEKPRCFISANSFFGPDRRRRKAANYQGPFRRDGDQSSRGARSNGINDPGDIVFEESKTTI